MSDLETTVYDLTIIGGGPIGIYGACYAGMHGLHTKIIDALPQPGGQLAALYPEKYIYDLPGHPQIKAAEMIEMLLTQMNQYQDKIEYVGNTTVQTLEKQENHIFKICTDHECHFSRSVIITAGNGAFKPRMLGVDNEEQLTNVHYFVSDLQAFKGKNVAIFGGGDSAVDWALMLEGVASNVSLIHRRNEFRAHLGSVDRLQASTTKLLTPYTLESVQADNHEVKTLTLLNSETLEKQTIEADEVIVLFGFISSLGPIKEWDIDLDKNALSVNRQQQTSVSGIFAAGDACTYEGKIKMITAGFGEVVTAVNAAIRYAYPEKNHVPKHSSTLKK